MNRVNKHAYVKLVLSAIFVLCLGALVAPMSGCGTTQPVNTGQQAGQPNGRNANVQGNYIEQMTVNLTLPANATADKTLTIVGAPDVKPGSNNRQDITSQPANSGGSKGGDVASGNQTPVQVGGTPTLTTPTQTVAPTTDTGGGAIQQPSTPTPSGTSSDSPAADGGGGAAAGG